jgi:hypothetical protein
MTVNDAIGFAIDHPTLVSSAGFFLCGLLLGYMMGIRGRRRRVAVTHRVDPRF